MSTDQSGRRAARIPAAPAFLAPASPARAGHAPADLAVALVAAALLVAAPLLAGPATAATLPPDGSSWPDSAGHAPAANTAPAPGEIRMRFNGRFRAYLGAASGGPYAGAPSGGARGRSGAFAAPAR